MTGGSDAPIDYPLPSLKRYDRATLNRVADELDGLPEDAAVRILIRDYGVTREEIRALQRQAAER